ncbi:MAG: flagellar motor protein [Planctomycetota bacterium]|nr:MAG: flagellar motor protein [Planctomycetota bacterium]
MKPDPLTIGGIIVAFASVIGGQILEGGHPSSIMQPTAALIVLGGTLGACLLSFPLPDVLFSVKCLKSVFFAPARDVEQLIATLLELAKKARKEGLIALEADADQTEDPFLKKALLMAVDGTDPKLVHETLETVIYTEEERWNRAAKVWESAGGYAPTVGILGAVLGLIHVMENLSDPSSLGGGIAVAFVATVYGVASANLFFLPFANKLKLRTKEESLLREMQVTGVLAIQTGDNIRLIEEKLRAVLPPKSEGESK